MTLRATLSVELEPDVSVTVVVAAMSLGCDPSTVRTLLRTGQLSGHKVGKGTRPSGVRVHGASIRAYKLRHAVGGEPAADVPAGSRHTSQRTNAAHQEAMARLRQLGAL